GASRRRGWVALVLWAALAVGLTATWWRGAEAQVQTAAAPPRDGASALPGLPLGAEHAIGAPAVVDNLTVFPIYAKSPEDLGEFTALEAALASRTAVVREASGDAPPPVVQSARRNQHGRVNGSPIASAGDGARVDTVVI